MTIEQFTQTVDGIINDYTNAITDGKEFRDQIADLLIEVARPALSETPDDESQEDKFVRICVMLNEMSEDDEVFCKALLRIAAQVLNEKHDNLNAAEEIQRTL
ncbi:MAG: hypothetical protein EAZ32_06280 [Cytophagia bacterium]|nr:MAG: hypothetical protein EAZ32_06280 [Cytophagia bacterium]